MEETYDGTEIPGYGRFGRHTSDQLSVQSLQKGGENRWKTHAPAFSHPVLNGPFQLAN